MIRTYTDVSDFRAPFDSPNLSLSGTPLGDHEPLERRSWHSPRSYYDVSNFVAPYDDGFYQNNTLFGLGADPDKPEMLPPELKRYLMTGAPMGTTMRDLRAALSQVPRVAWAALAVLGLGSAYLSYRAANRKG